MMTRTPRRARRRSAALLVLLVIVALAGCAASSVHAQSTSGERASADAAADHVPEFVATSEWKELLPGQGIPRGLHVRINLETGKKEAKLMDPADAAAEESLRSVVVDPDSTVTVATDVEGEVDAVVTQKAAPAAAARGGAVAVVPSEASEATEIAADDVATTADSKNDDEAPPAKEPAWNHEKIYEVLQALPEPPVLEDGMDINEAHAKLSQAEFRRQIVKLWKKRQQDLKDAIESMQDDSKHLSELLEQFRVAERTGDTDAMVHALEVLEWEVQDLDKTYVFNFIGGFEIIAGYLNSTNLPVRAHAAWIIGSAAKNYKDGQNWAIDAGAVPKLVEALALKVPVSDENDSQALKEIFEVKKKALYAISSLVLFNERGQRLFLLHHGPDALAAVFDGVVHPASVQLKAALLVHDLLLETDPKTDAADAGESSLKQLQRILRSAEWCQRLSAFFIEHAPKLRHRQVLEILGAMRNQLPGCQATFQAAGVKSGVEAAAAAFAQDKELDAEEKREIAAFFGELLGFL